MVDSTHSHARRRPEPAVAAHAKHDRRSLTYSNTFENGFQRNFIRAMEWTTGKLTILRLVSRFEAMGAPRGQEFWRACLEIMGIPVLTPAEQLARIPEEGPVIVVANHPHGLVDGMVMADLIGRRRSDYKILARQVLDGIDEEASAHMIPVPFPHDPQAQKKMIEMRAESMAFLKQGGLIALFPSGVVASSETMFGPAVEAEWNVFTAQMIRRSGASVVPIHFKGHNSRWYQMANRVSATLRQGLLLHEIVHALNRPQTPVVGDVLTDEQVERVKSDPRGFMAWLREHTLSL